MKGGRIAMKLEIIPHDDGSGFRHTVELIGDEIWIDRGSVMVRVKDWPKLRDAVGVMLRTAADLSKPDEEAAQ